MDFGVAHASWAAPGSSLFLSLKAAPVHRRGLFFETFGYGVVFSAGPALLPRETKSAGTLRG